MTLRQVVARRLAWLHSVLVEEMRLQFLVIEVSGSDR